MKSRLIKHALSLILCVLSLSIIAQPCNDDFAVTLEHLAGRFNICEGEILYRINFKNGGASPVGPGVFEIELNDDDHVTLEQIVSGAANYQILSGQSTGLAQVSMINSIAPGEEDYLMVRIAISCSLWDIILNGNGQLPPFHLRVRGFDPNFDCFDVPTLDHPIRYSLVTPNPAAEVYNVNLGEPFTASIQMAVQGDACDSDFFTFIEFDPCIDYSNATIAVTDMGYSQNAWIYTLNSPNVEDMGNGLRIQFDLSSLPFPPWPPKKPCLASGVYSGAYGSDINIDILDLVMTCCADGGANINYSTTTCDYQSPPTCLSGGELDTQGGPTTHFVNVPNGGVPSLSLNVSSTTGIKVCNENGAIYLTFEICNNSTGDPGHAYDVDFSYSNGMGLAIQNAWVNGSPILLSFNSNSININFGNGPNTDLDDVNQDGVFSELAKGHCAVVDLQLEYIDTDCFFDGYTCPANFDVWAYRSSVNWNNQCGTLIPEESISNNRNVEFISQNGYIDPTLGHLDPILQQNTNYSLALCLYDIDMSGWSGILAQGAFNQCITASSNYPNVTWGALHLSNGGPPIYPSGPNGDTYVFPSGMQVENECVEIEFSFNCDGAPMAPIELSFTSKGYFDDCPDCFVELSCAQIHLFTICPGGDPPPPCDIADFIDITLENAEADVTTALGKKRAYPCDQVLMEVTATSNINYTGPFEAFFSYSSSLPQVFDSYDVNVSIGGNGIAMSNMPNINNNTYSFPSQTNVTIAAGDLIKVSIIATVGTDPIPSWAQPLELFYMGFVFNGEACGEAAPEEFLILNIDATLETGNQGSCCTGQSRYFRIKYTGGTNGTDFPAPDERIVARFVNDITASVDQGNITSIRDNLANVNINTTPPTPNSSVTFSSDDLQLNPKNSFTGYSHNFTINYEPGCGEPATHLTVDRPWADGYYSEPSDCYKLDDDQVEYSSGVSQPDVHVQFIQDFLQIHENHTEVDFKVWITGQDACFPYIIIEYDPAAVAVTLTDPVVNSTTGNCGSNEVLAFQLGQLNIGQEFMGTLNLEFLNASCEEGVPIRIYGSHFCAGGSLPDPVACPDQLNCVENMDETLITFLPSALTILGHDCTPNAEQCEIHYWSFVVKNPGEGDDYQVGLNASIPTGYELVEGFFEYPYSGNVNNCSGGSPLSSADLSAIVAGTWVIPTGSYWGEADGFLPGLSHQGSTTAERTFHVILGIRGTCKSDPDQTAVTFEAAGLRNCGDLISASFDGELNHSLDEFIVPEVSVTVSEKYNCATGEGTLFFEIDFLDDNLDISPDQEFKLTLYPGFGVEIFCKNPIIFNYEDQTVSCTYTLTEDGCSVRSFYLGYELSTCLTQSCGEEECETEMADILFGSYPFNPIDRWISFDPVVISTDFCDETSTIPSDITTCINNNDATPGTTISAQLWCDVNGNGILDSGDEHLTSTLVTLGPVGSCTDITFSMTPADFHSECGSGQVIVTALSKEDYCLCVKDNTGKLPPCECVEDITVVYPECVTPGEEFCVTYNFNYYGPPTSGVSSLWYIAINSSDPGWTMTAPSSSVPISYGPNSVEVCLVYDGDCIQDGINLVIRGDMYTPQGVLCCTIRDEQALKCCCDCSVDIQYCFDPEQLDQILRDLDTQLKSRNESNAKLYDWVHSRLEQREPCQVEPCCPICEAPDYQGLVMAIVNCPNGTPDGLTYLWNTGDSGPVIIGTYPGTYSVVVSDPSTDCIYQTTEDIICGEVPSGDGKLTQHDKSHIDNLQLHNLFDNSDELSVKPNPVNHTLFVRSTRLTNNDLLLINQFGQVVHNELNASSDQISIDVSTLPDGLYFAVIRDNNGVTISSKMVVVSH